MRSSQCTAVRLASECCSMQQQPLLSLTVLCSSMRLVGSSCRKWLGWLGLVAPDGPARPFVRVWRGLHDARLAGSHTWG